MSAIRTPVSEERRSEERRPAEAGPAEARTEEPSARAPGRRALWLPVGVLAGAAVAAGYVRTVDPSEVGHYPGCPFLMITGWYCPGCGATRMAHALGNGQPLVAFGLNPLLFALLPVAGYLWARWAVCRVRGQAMASVLLRPAAVSAFLALTMVFWVVRNLPFGAALAP